VSSTLGLILEYPLHQQCNNRKMVTNILDETAVLTLCQSTWHHIPTLVQKGVLYSGSKIYNYLPLNIKMLSKDAKQFKSKLRSYLIEHTFYSLDEYYQFTF